MRKCDRDFDTDIACRGDRPLLTSQQRPSFTNFTIERLAVCDIDRDDRITSSQDSAANIYSPIPNP
jgi:hypothetical protein